ncbi:MAG TPA: MFS transporter [Acidimicrobiales bacterium]|jgi:EmrB/QacA subfamily drug resistance transporter|nr:MFS transporter [Acidimicrobiales bacterium]
MTIPATETVASEVPTGDRRRWIALVVVCFGMFMAALDGSIVNVALPAIQKSLHFSQSGLTWVVDAYLISFGSFLLMAGRLGDLIGRKKVFLAGITLFTLASIVCGSASTQEMLVVSRFVQGIGGALMSSVIVAIIVTEFPSMAERAKAMSAYVFVAVGGGSVGLLAGGVLTQVLSWHWIFFVNVPVGVATMIAGSILLVDNVGLGIKTGVDWLGSALVTASVMVAIYAMVTASSDGWGSAHTFGFLGLAAVLMTAFILLEARITNPIMPLRILKLRTLTGSAVIRGLLVVGMFSTFFIGALYFEHVLHYSPVKTGLAFLPQTLAMAGMSTGITAWLVTRFGNKPVLYPAMVLAAVGLLLFATAGPHAAYFPRIFFAFLLIGTGAGTSFMPLIQIGMSEIPNEDAGLGSGMVNVSQQLAGAIGLAALGTIAENHSKSLVAAGHDVVGALADGYQLALLIAAACVVLGLVVAPFLLRTKESPEEQAARIKENMQNPEAYEHLVL